MAYASFPIRDAAVVPADPKDPKGKNLPKVKVGEALRKWLSGLSLEVDARPKRNAQINLTLQGAAIATTPLPIGDVTQGLWRISIAIRVTRPATLNSAVQGFLTWTERGVVQIESMTNLVGNLTTTREGKTFFIRADGATPISYSTTYGTAGATSMQYSVDATAELVAGDL